jgi:hypothetical protein
MTPEEIRIAQLEIAVDTLRKSIREDVSKGVQDGIKALANDTDFAELFWKTGFDELTSHASTASSQWLGKRILTSFILAVTTAGIIWLVNSGKFKI